MRPLDARLDQHQQYVSNQTASRQRTALHRSDWTPDLLIFRSGLGRRQQLPASCVRGTQSIV
jgi:hypothetical protein